ncbi:hypothetical protein F4810DRAFT_714933 [Camillea tinctor]|nr:hypothetical protein F4810DRAFT_714933 [Camillea tinctor]
MEEATKSIKSLAKDILPIKAHYLSLSATRRYQPHPDDKRLDEQDIRPLQYTTFLSDADRGVLLTRAYFDVREDPIPPNHAPTPTPLRIDPNKPKKKVSLKDYKNRKVEGESPKPDPQPQKLSVIKEKEKEKEKEKDKDKDKDKEREKEREKEKDKDREPTKKPPDPIAKEMDGNRDVRKGVPDIRREAHRQRSPSPDRRKRIADTEEIARPVKRNKIDNATPQATSVRSSKDAIPPKKTLGGKESSKSLPVTNGKHATGNSNARGASPKPSSQVNGSHRNTPSSQTIQKKTGSSTPNSRALPPLLSPTLAANVSDLVKEDVKTTRVGLKKKPAETNNLKPPARKPRNDPEPSPSPTKRRKIPPLLSPTLPPIVMEELAKMDTRPLSKESGLRSSQISDSPGSIKKASTQSKREETIHVENKKDEPDKYLVVIKYKKRLSKTIERLLALPPGGKKRSEALKREDRPAREIPDGVEPGTARKRPRTGTDGSESIKRPRMSDNLRPSTPPRQSTAMSRIASNSSQAGTPGMVNNTTPAAQPAPEQRRPSLNLEQVQKLRGLQGGHRLFMELGTKLKHERDNIMKNHDTNRDRDRDRDRQIAIAAGIQSVLSYMHAVKLQSDGFDIERTPRRLSSWKEVLALFRVVRIDCSVDPRLTALLFRIQGICLVYLGRAMWNHSHDMDIAKEAIANSKEQVEIWRAAANARKRLGTYDGSSDASDGGPVGKLIDRLGPWSSPDEAIPIALEVLRKVIRIGSPWKPAEELVKIGSSSSTNGVRS